MNLKICKQILFENFCYKEIDGNIGNVGEKSWEKLNEKSGMDGRKEKRMRGRDGKKEMRNSGMEE